ncbi:MAG: histidine phosphatase family protein [Pseudomonadota bacterium]
MAVELWLVRHGQAAFASDDYDRLTDLGLQQARWLGEHFAEMEVRFDRIASGRLRRQRETADAVAGVLGATAEIAPGLEEYDAKALLAGAGFKDRDPSLSRREHFKRLRGVLIDWSQRKTEGAESWQDFRDRVMAAISALTDNQDGRVFAAASGGSIAMALTTILDLAPEQMIEFNLQARNTGISRLVFTRQRVYFNMFNAIPHLERPDRRHAETYS